MRALDNIATLRELFELRDGHLYWRERPGVGGSFNHHFAGKLVRPYLNNCGYPVVSFRAGQRREIGLVHRIVWALANGRLPSMLDHINGDPADYRLENLREVTPSENQKNSRLPRHNTSGAVGVGRVLGRWRAYIHVNGKMARTARFDSFEEALAARKEWEREFDFHPNHGRRVEA